jgi:hypothetical protein
MPIFSLVIEHECRSYSTQVEAESVAEAAERYFADVYPKTYKEAFGTTAVELNVLDIIYVVPMEGLMNIWSISAGREGRYVSIVCVLTADSERQEN